MGFLDFLFPKKKNEQEPKSVQNSFSMGDRQELEALVRAGQKIAAIKFVREKTTMGLKEAKDFIDSLEIGPPL